MSLNFMVAPGINLIGQRTGDKMKKSMVAGILVLLTVSCTSAQADDMQADIKAFQTNAENCQYLAGEWDSSLPKSRQKEIEVEVDKYCNLARKQQEQLKKKYKTSKQVEEVISQYDL